MQIGAELLYKGGIREYRVWSIEYRESQKEMVTGDGHGHREFRVRPFGHRELAPGIRRLKAERLTPGRLNTVAVTRHLECGIVGHKKKPPITEAVGSQHVTMPADPRATRSVALTSPRRCRS